MKLIFLLKLTYSSLICIRIYYKLNYHFYPVFISINFNFNCKNKNKKKISFIFFIPFNFLYVYIYFIRILSFASNSFRSSILLLTKGYCSNISIKRRTKSLDYYFSILEHLSRNQRNQLYIHNRV